MLFNLIQSGIKVHNQISMKKLNFFFAACLLLIVSFSARGQEIKESLDPQVEVESEDGFLIGADFVSRYVWRGMDIGNSPAVQPTIGFSWKGLEFGAWGSYAFTSMSIPVNDSVTIDAGPFSEVDLYVSYNYKWITVMLFDYFSVNGLTPGEGNNYFDIGKATTGHTLEGLVFIDGPEKLPFRLTVGTLLYGDDKNQDSTGLYGAGEKNNFSTYLELEYTFKFPKYDVELKPFIGASLKGSLWYGDKPGIINLGVSARKEIPVTEKFSFPVQASLVTNPMAESIFLVFSVSL